MAIKEIWEAAGQKQRNDLLTLIVMDGGIVPNGIFLVQRDEAA